MAVILVIGGLLIGTVILTLSVWHPEWFSVSTAASTPAVQRVRRVIGFAIVAAAVAILFLPVRAPWYVFEGGDPPPPGLEDCGTGWNALFYNRHTPAAYNHCAAAASPHLWIAGGVAAVGIGLAFWGASRGRLLGMMSLALAGTLLVAFASLITSQNMGG